MQAGTGSSRGTAGSKDLKQEVLCSATSGTDSSHSKWGGPIDQRRGEACRADHHAAPLSLRAGACFAAMGLGEGHRRAALLSLRACSAAACTCAGRCTTTACRAGCSAAADGAGRSATATASSTSRIGRFGAADVATIGAAAATATTVAKAAAGRTATATASDTATATASATASAAAAPTVAGAATAAITTSGTAATATAAATNTASVTATATARAAAASAAAAAIATVTANSKATSTAAAATFGAELGQQDIDPGAAPATLAQHPTRCEAAFGCRTTAEHAATADLGEGIRRGAISTAVAQQSNNMGAAARCRHTAEHAAAPDHAPSQAPLGPACSPGLGDPQAALSGWPPTSCKRPAETKGILWLP
mmetsp:Transcript_12763/g.38482  ORF Transcript_12763/g.38482 Transcript_12763/m.38482 type:complete len:368 (+) Transcript_12763:4067-5170(+)